MSKNGAIGDKEWSRFADEYKSMTQGVAEKPIARVIALADSFVPFSKATAILDNGCGPGPIMERLLDGERTVALDSRLICSDWSEGMMKAVQRLKEQKVQQSPESAWAKLEIIQQNAMDLKEIPDDSLSHVTAGWVYFLTDDPQKCLRESLRVLKPDGVLSLSSWQGNQWMDMCQVIVEDYPDKTLPTIPDGWGSPEGVKEELEKAGFKDVVSEPVEVAWKFENLAQTIDFMLERFPFVTDQLKTLSEEQMKILKEKMLARGRRLCPDEPGALTGVSIAAAGRKA